MRKGSRRSPLRIVRFIGRFFNIVNNVVKWTKNKKKAKYCDYQTNKTGKRGAFLGRLMCDKSLRIIAGKFTPDPSVEQISVASRRAKAAVNVGASFQINPGATAGKKFKSSKKKVATVKNGVVTFKKKGKVTITCTAVRGKKKARVKFAVSK